MVSYSSPRISAYLCVSAVNRLFAHILPQRRRGTQRYAEKKFKKRHDLLRGSKQFEGGKLPKNLRISTKDKGAARVLKGSKGGADAEK